MVNARQAAQRWVTVVILSPSEVRTRVRCLPVSLLGPVVCEVR